MTTQLFMTTYLIMTITLICLPLLNTSNPKFTLNTTKSVKMAFLVSTIPLMLLVNQKMESITVNWQWLNLNTMSANFTLQFDHYSLTFVPIALFVTWNILEFSLWYMHEDPKMNLFFKYLLIFLLAMIILVYAGNLFILFIGWEGVGMMSFLLIGWYHGRSNAGAAAIQAVLYNRVGDIGFLFTISWFLMNSSSLDLHYMFSMDLSTQVLIALIVAAASKSAQFSLHPWLASAMEGPTPVSALLHSSTMVVAGIFLLIRIHPMMENNQTALTTCLCLGAISTMFAATSAITQNDIKKIIAYSTSSQLGLMMVAIGINFPNLAFFHICTHAFFKAMLFLCSGSIIHNLSGEQDIRKMGGLQKSLPITTACLSIGSLALMGTPFLAGFFSKDAIIEAMNTSWTNSWALLLTIIATSFTAVYSLRMVFFVSMQQPRSNPIVSINENNPLITSPLKRLAMGSVISGLMLYNIIIPNNPTIHTMPTYAKITALAVTIIAFMLALDLTKSLWSTPQNKQPMPIDPSFYHQVIHRLVPSTTLNTSSQTMSHLLDTIWYEMIFPKMIATSQLPPIKLLLKLHSGLISTYLSALAITLIISFTTLHFV
uniref:NADH-ubiquinone oxidoreductase chain 5 n=1 Tax=Leptopelis vermiculatus TaxID=39602 RepID=S4V1Q6_9NEOB|nr:NADH dehydrogenase subunit 5 [Leptopelis vermiculatus]